MIIVAAEIEFLCITIFLPLVMVGKTATIKGFTHEISSPLLVEISVVAAYAN